MAAQAQRRSRQGPVVFPVLADAGAACRRRVSGRLAVEAGRARRGAPARTAWSPTSQTARRSVSSPTATTRRSSRGGRRDARSGAIVDERGATLGSHEGVHRFTIGQRKGLGIATGAPLYVLKIDADSGDVTVGPRAALERTIADRVRRELGVRRRAGDLAAGLCADPSPPSRGPGRVSARSTNGRAELEFDEPQAAVTPGQAVVFYDDEVVVGGGWIE